MSDPVAAFTLWLAVATTGLWVFTYKLWRSSVDLAKDTRDGEKAQADKMERSIAEGARAAAAMEGVAESMAINAKQIVESVEVSRTVARHQERFAKAQMRAYISVLIDGATYQQGEVRFEAAPTIVNNGATPARNLRYRICADILPHPLPADFRFPLPTRAQGQDSNILGPQQNGIMVAVVGRLVPVDDVAKIKVGEEQSLYVWGTLSYEDIFGHLHRCTFAQQLYWQQSGPRSESGDVPEIIRGWHLSKHNRTN